MTRRLPRRAWARWFLMIPVFLVVSGCEDVDWDWEARWWRQPTRRVRPDGRARATPADAEPPQQQTAQVEPPRREAELRPAAPEPKRAEPAPAAPRTERVATAPPPSAPPVSSPPQSSPPAARAERPMTLPPPARSSPGVQAGPDELFEVGPNEKTPAAARTEPRPAPPPVRHEAPAAPARTEPSRTPPAQPARRDERAAMPQSEPRPMTPPPASTPPATTPPATPRPVSTPPSSTPPSSTPRLPAGASDAGAFYQLYLATEDSAARSGGSEARVRLQNVPARAAAQVLAQLHVPVGVGGGDTQQYLIYQDRDQWQAARDAVSMLDVASGATSGFDAAMRGMIDLNADGMMPQRDDVEKCRTALTAAASDASLDAKHRWAAHILAGRLAAEQIYDYAAARQHYDAAAQVAGAGTVEALTARWWAAESLDLEGNNDGAKQAYQAIVRDFAAHPQAQAVQRASTYQTGRRR